MSDYRLYTQAFKTWISIGIRGGQIILPFNDRVTEDVCPTLTTRPEGFKTAIFVTIEL